MQVREVRRLKELEQENTRLKKLLAETILEKEALQEVVKKR
jgi:putative transposase